MYPASFIAAATRRILSGVSGSTGTPASSPVCQDAWTCTQVAQSEHLELEEEEACIAASKASSAASFAAAEAAVESTALSDPRPTTRARLGSGGWSRRAGTTSVGVSAAGHVTALAKPGSGRGDTERAANRLRGAAGAADGLEVSAVLHNSLFLLVELILLNEAAQ